MGETILGGITRDSVAQLAKDMGIEVQERAISIQELEEANQNGTLKEAFGKEKLNTLSGKKYVADAIG